MPNSILKELSEVRRELWKTDAFLSSAKSAFTDPTIEYSAIELLLETAQEKLGAAVTSLDDLFSELDKSAAA